MGRILSFIGSMKSMAVLMLIFAVAIGYATIIENDFGTMSAKADVYNARWFEVLLGILAINLIYNIFKYKMYKLKNLPIFIFHIGFLVILLGAAITRYIGFEGTMHIREGETSASMISADNYFIIKALNDGKIVSLDKRVYLSKRTKNHFEEKFSINTKQVDISLIRYIPDAVEKIIEDPNGVAMIQLMVTGNGRGTPVVLAQGNFYDAGSFILDFDSKKSFSKPVIKIFIKDKKLYMAHDTVLKYLKMVDQSQGELSPSSNEVLHVRTLYSTPYGSFVLRKFYPKAIKQIVSNDKKKIGRMMMNSSGYDALLFRVRVNADTKEVMIFGQQGVLAQPKVITIDGVDIQLGFGAKEIELPFALKLVDFKLKRYPGSMSPASYESDVVLIDKEEGIKMPYRIYMNHILEHRGYRFFQASYDQDEKGTVLSVNHDPGTIWAYLGYLMLGIGMFWSLFSKKHRFAQLLKKAQKARDAKNAIATVALAVLFSFSPSLHADETALIAAVSKQHANKFAHLVVQDTQGRMKPMDTLSIEILAKIHRSSSLKLDGKELDPNQVILGMMIRPDLYKNVKLIRTGKKEINRLLGVPDDTKYVSFSQFFADPKNLQGYKLAKQVNEAARKAAKNQNKLDKDFLKIDEKVNVVYMVFTGSLIKIWPLLHDPKNTWYDTISALQRFPTENAKIVKDLAVNYFHAVDNGLQNGSWKEADKALANIEAYQKRFGSAVYPSPDRIKAEVFYNHANIFETIYPIYLLVGFVLLILSFIKIIKPKFGLEKFSKASLYILVVLFIAHTIGLALRWYISGHAPWSNGYESMIYIGWASVLAGFIFSKKSPITMAATGILTGLILFVAHLNWMNPQVTNLVPVLNSYWLSIHVSMITASYGFLALGALLGFITLILFIVKKGKNEQVISYAILELNAINEMSLMIGLAMLTIGNFLGGVWANESWGRYWGWDPKETWALVTILVYAVVVHLRFIKKIYNEFNYTVISLMAFTSVLMTYFGVNYYLAGLHSYAKGDPVPIPDFVPVSYTIIFIVIALAYRNRKLNLNKDGI